MINIQKHNIKLMIRRILATKGNIFKVYRRIQVQKRLDESQG
jgi:hypothetical protein